MPVSRRLATFMPSIASSTSLRLGVWATPAWCSTATRFRRASLACLAIAACPSTPWFGATAGAARSTRGLAALLRRPTTPLAAGATSGRVRCPSSSLAVVPLAAGDGGSCDGPTTSMAPCRGCRRIMHGLVVRCRTFIVRRLVACGPCPTCRVPRFSPTTTSMDASRALVASTCPGSSIGSTACAPLTLAATATRGMPAPGP